MPTIVMQIRPIAGTRPRGKTADEDLALEKDLLADPKERAEHVMLVDLARNDIGRVCEYGSVKVEDMMVIERYSHVMHIVSSVTGKLYVKKLIIPAGANGGGGAAVQPRPHYPPVNRPIDGPPAQEVMQLHNSTR